MNKEKRLTDAELDDLCKRLREDAARWSDEMIMGSLEREAADAITALREQVATQSNAADMIAEERDAWEKRAKALEADNAVLLYERDEAQMRLGRTVKILVGIYELLYPPTFKHKDGRTLVFHSPSVHEQMQQLSDRIRAIPNEIAMAQHMEKPGIDRPNTARMLRQLAADNVKLEADNAALRTRAIKAECVLQVLLAEVSVTMHHAETFIISREKMHPDGITLWQKLLGKIDAAMLAGKEKTE